MAVDSKRVQEVFLAAVEIENPVQRAAILDRECAAQPELRERVEELLQAHASPDSIVDGPSPIMAPASAQDATVALEPSAEPQPPFKNNSKTSDGSNADDDESRLDFLQASTKPGSIGRLGHYEILQVIGKGGFGTVLKAFDEKLHRVVAIKVLAPELAASATARNRFIREARAAAAITHEHVVTIHVVDEEHRPPYLVMQLIDGMTLQQKLDKVGALSLMEVLRIGMQMAEGLAAAHKQGLVHRDIKPANVLLENGIERVKITDFGLAKIADDASVTQTGVVAGTPMYMSPEQANGQTIDHRSDLFSLGTVLYAMCTGRPPFRASGTMAVLKRVIDDTPRPVREINAEIPGWLETIITKLHSKNPEDRYQTARAVADVLSHRLADLQSHGRAGDIAERDGTPPAKAAITSSTQAQPESRNWSWLWLAIGVATLSLAAFMVYSFFVTGIDVRDLVRAHEPYWAGAGVLAVLAICLLFMPSLIPGARGGMAARAVRFLAVAPACVAIPLIYAGWKNYGNYATIHLSTDNSIYVGALIQGPNYRTSIHFSNREGNLSPYIVPPGDYAVAVTHGGAVFFSEKFSLERGGVKSVHIPRLKSKGASEPEGWVALFNGKDLDGWDPWHVTGEWKVEDRVLVGRNAPGYLFSARPYGNFHLRVEAKINADGWGGLAFRHTGENHGNVAICPKRGKSGSLHFFNKDKNQVLQQPEKQLASPDTWLKLELIVQGRTAVVLLNDVKTAEATIDGLPDAGPILLCADAPGTVIHFRKIEIKELPTKTPEAARPFAVLARDGKAERKFTVLSDAVAAAQAGDTIEIRGDGPFVCEPIKLHKKELRIKAKEGFQPVIRLKSADVKPLAALFATQARLILEGLILELESPEIVPKTHPFPRIILSLKAPIHVANCRFSSSEAPCVAIMAAESPICEVRNCSFLGDKIQCGVEWNVGKGDPGRAVVDNSLLAGGFFGLVVGQGETSAPGAIYMQRNTLAVAAPITCSFYAEAPAVWTKAKPDPLRMEVKENIFAGPIIGIVKFNQIFKNAGPAGPLEAGELLPRHLSWKEQLNLFPKDVVFLHAFSLHLNLKEHTFTLKSLADWQRFWKLTDPGFLEGAARFQIGDLTEKTTATPVSPGGFRLVKGSPGQGVLPGGKDLGVDVDLLGPGAAYERWQKTPEYQEWLKTGQDTAPPLAVAPFNIDKARAHQDAWAEHLGVELEITNSIGMKLRLIPPGEFLMGTSQEEIAQLLKEAPDLKDAPEHIKDNVRSEGPQRRVTIKAPFFIGAHEVTVGNFREFVRATKHRTDAETGQGGVTWNDEIKKWERKPENVWDNAELSGGDAYPVVFVALADAQSFCAWLTKQEGRTYALPAEEQWEWACRAGTTTPWFFGDDADLMRHYGWTTPLPNQRRPVGRLAPNPFGLYDIYGNVQELTISLQEKTIARGGQAGESPHRARSASRVGVDRRYDPAVSRGFRVVIVGDLKAKTPLAKP